jgi:diguanylate cyclase (GGDEF)-like protein
VRPDTHFLPVGPWNTDGLLFVHPELEWQQAEVERIVLSGHPAVQLGPGAAACSRVLVDNAGGTAAAVAHLIEHGHRKIGYIGTPVMGDQQIRWDTFHATMAEAGLDVAEASLFRVGKSDVDGEAAARLFVERDKPCTAVVVPNDTVARYFVAELALHGVRVPEDVAVTGYDDLIEARASEPPLTTAQYPMDKMTARALEVLLAHIADPALPAETHLVPSELTVRQSCGCKQARHDHSQEFAFARALIERSQVARASNSFALDLATATTRDEVLALMDASLPAFRLRHGVLVGFEAEGADHVAGSVVQSGAAAGTVFPTRAFPPAEIAGDAERFSFALLPQGDEGRGGYFAFDLESLHAAIGVARHVEDMLITVTAAGQAITDPLTELGNRRKLEIDLAELLKDDERLLALYLFDLDGFKNYNDNFGHPAGDALLVRLAQKLMSVLDGVGQPYRMGGDEFCAVVPLAQLGDIDRLAAAAVAALSESGTGFEVGCSYGHAVIPVESSELSEALRIADQRLYANKHSGRRSAAQQVADTLHQALTERSVQLAVHVSEVAQLARELGLRLGIGGSDLDNLVQAAALHDIGKIAMPDGLLSKPAPLEAQDWTMMREHALIGERIVSLAPALAATARLIRSTHEWVDGTGYPDGLAGDEIPLGSRVIAVCDAFNAMTGERPYRLALPAGLAAEELRQAAGTQFDSEIVECFIALIAPTLATGESTANTAA